MTTVRVRVTREAGLLQDLKKRIEKSSEVLLSSAYVSPAGVEELLPSIMKLLRAGGEMQLYATFDGTVATKPEAFRKLADLKRQWPNKVGLFLYPHGNSLFHAKAFLFKDRKGSWSGIIGSANLTHAALTGKNVELAVDLMAMAQADVKVVRNEISRLRESGYFMEVNEGSLARVLNTFGVTPPEPESAADERRMQQRRFQANQRVESLLSAPPGKLPPLAELVVSSRAYVEDLVMTGVGVGGSAELDDVVLSFQLETFVRAGVVVKVKSQSVGRHGRVTSKQGQTIELVPKPVRALVTSASRSLGSAISGCSVDFGFARWLPRPALQGLLGEVASNENVKAAKKGVNADSPEFRAHLLEVSADFEEDVRQIVAELQIQTDLKLWDRSRSEEVSSWPQSLSPQQVRARLVEHVVRTHRSRISEQFVRSKIARLSFDPTTFEFPVQRVVGSDTEFGHRHFLACLAWSVTDPNLKRSDGGKGRGLIFKYLDARFRLNISRQGLGHRATYREAVERLAEQASEWLGAGAELDSVVSEFRTIFGDAPWTWDRTDLAERGLARA